MVDDDKGTRSGKVKREFAEFKLRKLGRSVSIRCVFTGEGRLSKEISSTFKPSAQCFCGDFNDTPILMLTV